MLEELRKKPKGLKEAYAFWGAAIFTGLVAIVWLASLPVRFSAIDTAEQVENQAETNSAFSQFFGQLKENITGTWQQNKEALEDLSGVNQVTATSTAATSSVSSTSSIIIATSSEKSILIGTSTKQNQ